MQRKVEDWRENRCELLTLKPSWNRATLDKNHFGRYTQQTYLDDNLARNSSQ